MKSKKYLIAAVVIIIVAGLILTTNFSNSSFLKSDQSAHNEVQMEEDLHEENHESYEEPEGIVEMRIISINGSQFDPAESTMYIEDELIFENKDDITHTITADDSNIAPYKFEEFTLKPNESKEVFHLKETGTLKFFLKDSSAIGTIEVVPSE